MVSSAQLLSHGQAPRAWIFFTSTICSFDSVGALCNWGSGVLWTVGYCAIMVGDSVDSLYGLEKSISISRTLMYHVYKGSILMRVWIMK